MIIMKPQKTNYLNLFALLEAEEHGGSVDFVL